ncbi:hypothetical protein DRQ50_00450 [bacterium]|nr:MAG: hypothetical protein DRQ50_00450 [bacterium]
MNTLHSLKILHLGKYYHPHRGGMETVLRQQAEGLVERGCRVTVLVAGSDTDCGRMQKGVRVVRALTAGTIRSQPVTPTLVGLLRRELVGRGPDLVILHLPNPLAAGAWLLATAVGGVPATRLAVWHHADITRQRVDAAPARWLQARCLAQAGTVWVSSAALAAGSRELIPWRSRVEVVPFGIDPRPWQIREPRRDGPFVFVGRLVPYKGLDVLLEAVATAPGIHLDLVGSGPLGTDLSASIRDRDLGDRVRLCGELDDVELADLMSRARALVLPSIDASETFGLVQLEAMAAALPVVASDLPTGVRNVGRDGVTHIMVPPGDGAALATALVRLQDDDLVARMGRAARLRVEDYSRDHMIDRILEAAAVPRTSAGKDQS